MTLKTLSDLEVGEAAEIHKVTVTGELGRRMRDMGLMPGADILVMGRAPLNDPVEIKLKGYNLTLRNNEADHILVTTKEA